MRFKLALVLDEENDLTIYMPDTSMLDSISPSVRKLEHGSAKTDVFPFHKALRDYFMENADEVIRNMEPKRATPENRAFADEYLMEIVMDCAKAYVDSNPDKPRQELSVAYELETFNFGEDACYERTISHQTDRARVNRGYTYRATDRETVEKTLSVTI